MGHINHVRTIRLTPEQLEMQRARIRRGRQLANQPWYMDGISPGMQTKLPEDELAPLITRFTVRQQKVYEKRADIITQLRAKVAPEVIARAYNIDVQFIRWIDGRSRA
jgi:hypothetical protein